MPGAPTAAQIEAFDTNPAIMSMADDPVWTVSGRIGDSSGHKAPLNAVAYLIAGVVYGAVTHDEECLVTKQQVVNDVCNGSPANLTAYLDIEQRPWMVVDIEPTCPPAVRDELLTLPYVYGEVSMSGKGYHLIMPLPGNLDEFPVASRKLKLQEEHGWWEILQAHLITFTRRTIEPVANPGGTGDWEAVYASLASLAKDSGTVGGLELSTDRPEIPDEDLISASLTRELRTKSLSDFNGDHSRWEFSVLSSLNRRLGLVLNTTAIRSNGHEYTDDELMWVLADACQEIVGRREKHEEYREGVPFLVHRAAEMLALSAPES